MSDVRYVHSCKVATSVQHPTSLLWNHRFAERDGLADRNSVLFPHEWVIHVCTPTTSCKKVAALILKSIVVDSIIGCNVPLQLKTETFLLLEKTVWLPDFFCCFLSLVQFTTNWIVHGDCFHWFLHSLRPTSLTLIWHQLIPPSHSSLLSNNVTLFCMKQEVTHAACWDLTNLKHSQWWG